MALRSVRFGIVGLGGWGSRVAAKLIDLGSDVVWAVDPHVDGAADEIPMDDPARRVVIATPPAFRLQVFEQVVAQGGKLVRFEKPLAGRPKDAWRILELADKHGVEVSIGMQMLRSPLLKVVREWVQGEAWDVEAVRTSTRPGNGGVITPAVDLGVHDLATVMYVLGEDGWSIKRATTSTLRASGDTHSVCVSVRKSRRSVRKQTWRGSDGGLITIDEQSGTAKNHVTGEVAQVPKGFDYLAADLTEWIARPRPVPGMVVAANLLAAHANHLARSSRSTRDSSRVA